MEALQFEQKEFGNMRIITTNQGVHLSQDGRVVIVNLADLPRFIEQLQIIANEVKG